MDLLHSATTGCVLVLHDLMDSVLSISGDTLMIWTAGWAFKLLEVFLYQTNNSGTHSNRNLTKLKLNKRNYRSFN